MPEQYRIVGARATEIGASVEGLIHAGRLPAGAGLPTVRALAADLAVSPTTVAAAYRTLRARGLVEADGRRGTRVRARSAARVRLPLAAPPGALDLSTGEPDPALLPDLRPALRGLRPRPVGYADAAVLPEFAALARDRLAADGVPADALTVTAGALDGIERCLAASTGPGDRVAVEDPGWANLLDLVAALGLTPVPVAVDDAGPRPEALAAALRRGVRALVVTGRAHNPTGACVDAARAADLRRALAGSPDVLVVEDDHAAELAGVPLATLAGATRRWALVRSASKPYGPDLRVAALAGDAETVDRVEGRRRLGAGWVSHLSQGLVAALWRDPAVSAVVARAAEAYDRRRTGLLDALADRGVAAHGRAGLNVWVPVADETTTVAALRDVGVVVAPGARFRIAGPPAVRVTVTPLDPVGTGPGAVGRVADALAAAMAPRRTRRGA